jgi:hypothetical protein
MLKLPLHDELKKIRKEVVVANRYLLGEAESNFEGPQVFTLFQS